VGGSDIVKHKGGVLTNLFDFFPKIVYRTCLQNIQIFVEIYYNILVTKAQLLTKLIFQILLEIEVNI